MNRTHRLIDNKLLEAVLIESEYYGISTGQEPSVVLFFGIKKEIQDNAEDPLVWNTMHTLMELFDE
jgi:hypothetical protein